MSAPTSLFGHRKRRANHPAGPPERGVPTGTAQCGRPGGEWPAQRLARRERVWEVRCPSAALTFGHQELLKGLDALASLLPRVLVGRRPLSESTASRR